MKTYRVTDIIPSFSLFIDDEVEEEEEGEEDESI